MGAACSDPGGSAGVRLWRQFTAVRRINFSMLPVTHPSVITVRIQSDYSFILILDCTQVWSLHGYRHYLFLVSGVALKASSFDEKHHAFADR
jgi:hypothetical protein